MRHLENEGISFASATNWRNSVLSLHREVINKFNLKQL